jgi:hypothetical protein
MATREGGDREVILDSFAQNTGYDDYADLLKQLPDRAAAKVEVL